MIEVLTAAEMRDMERAAIDSGQVSGLELMERAGRGVVDAIFAHWPEMAQNPRRAAVFCGPGNNGGDGFVVARLLQGWGWQVRVWMIGRPDALPADARRNCEAWQQVGPILPCGAADDLEGDLAAVGALMDEFDPDLVVDGLFGTGLVRPVTGALAELITAHMQGGARRGVAIDIPSGLCSDSGRVLGTAVQSDLTVSFQTAKLGHYLADGPALTGHLVVVGIGLGEAGAPRAPDRDGHWASWPGHVMLVAPPLGLGKGQGDHKYDHGHALILSGGAGRSGAARLAARGALRIGAGLVTLAVPPDAQAEVASGITALMMKPVADAADLSLVLKDERFTAVALGPGLGLGAPARDLVAAALAATPARAIVLDADALTVFADDPQALFDQLHPHAVLTPHGGEFARLFPDLAARLRDPATDGPAYSRVDAARAAAQRAGCVVLLKGADTVIAAPDGRSAINNACRGRAAPWLATAGSGDVLTGFVAGLLARGLDPFEAAGSAAWLHVEAARHFGPGLTAEDIPEQLPAVLRALGA